MNSKLCSLSFIHRCLSCEKRKVLSLALKDDRVAQCLRSCGSEFQALFIVIYTQMPDLHPTCFSVVFHIFIYLVNVQN